MTEVKIPSLAGMKQRLGAWWNGEEFAASTHENWALHGAPPKRSAQAPYAKHHDIPARLLVSQALWGEGNLTPGPADFITRLVNRLRLTPKMSMVDLGARLGGPARAINAAYGVWVTAYEWEEEVAIAGMEQSIMHGMGRKVPIVYLAPDRIERPERKIDCFYSKDALHLIPNKKALLQSVKTALKPNGQFLIVDYVMTGQGSQSPHRDAWNAAGEQISHFWRKEDYADALSGMRLELRVTEDMTAQYCEMIADGFRHLKNDMAGLIAGEEDTAKQAELRRALAFESNRWAARAHALQAGDIAVMRFSGATPE